MTSPVPMRHHSSPPFNRLAPLPVSAPAPARPIESLLFGVSNVDEFPVGSVGPSIRSTTRTLPKGIAKDALPVKVIDVPEFLLGENMKKERYDWKRRVIIELGNPNYKGALAPMREKGPEGKWKVSGLELHIYDAGENVPALPKEIHRESLKDNVVHPTENMIQTIEEMSDAENNPTDTAIPNQRAETTTDRNGTRFSVLESLTRQKTPFLSASQRSVSPENTTQHNRVPTSEGRNSAQQWAPQFYSSTTSGTNEVSTSAVQSRKYVSGHKQSASSAPFVTRVPFGTSYQAHQPRTVPPVRPSRTSLLPEEPVLSSAGISAPLIIKSEPESDPILLLSSGSPEAVSPRPLPRTATQSEPSHSLLRIEFDSTFCSGSNAVESLHDIARGFLRRCVCTSLLFASLTP